MDFAPTFRMVMLRCILTITALIDSSSAICLLARLEISSPFAAALVILFKTGVELAKRSTAGRQVRASPAQGNRVKKFSTNRLSAESVEIH
jgi:hypothetical protein